MKGAGSPRVETLILVGGLVLCHIFREKVSGGVNRGTLGSSTPSGGGYVYGLPVLLDANDIRWSAIVRGAVFERLGRLHR